VSPKGRQPGLWQRIFAGGNVFSAIERGNIEKCRRLLREDPAVLTQTDELGRTPLHVAAHNRCKEIVALLLSAGANPRSRDSSDATALHWAAVGGDPQVIEKLLAAGADVNAVDKDSLTPRELARMRGHAEIADLLGHYGGKK
jgi:ankyrin repeat protein